MKKNLFLLLVLLSAFTFDGCELFETDADPDLTWTESQNIYNECTGYYEYLDTRNLFYVQNAGYPFNGFPPVVLLYYREYQGGFFDCLGQPWYIAALPITIISYRNMTNLSTSASGKTSKTAKSPRARAYTKVVRPDGGEEKYDGPTVVFGDIPAGSTQPLETPITITTEGTYYNSYEADPDGSISESNEGNNKLFDNFERSSATDGKFSSKPSFIIKVPTEAELAQIKTRYVIYRNGQIEVRN